MYLSNDDKETQLLRNSRTPKHETVEGGQLEPSHSEGRQDGPQEDAGSRNFQGITFMLLSQLLLYLTTLTVKHVEEDHGIPSFQSLICRGIVTVIGAGAAIYHYKIPFGPSEYRLDIIMRGIGGSLAGGFLFLSSTEVNLDITYTIYYSSPFISALLAYWFLGEHLNYCELTSIFFGFVGVIFTIEPAFLFGDVEGDQTQDYPIIYLVIPFLAALTASFGYFFNRRAKPVSHQVLLFAVGVGMVTFGTIFLFTLQEPVAFTTASFLLTILASVLGYGVELLLIRGLKLEKLGVGVGTKFALIVFSHIGDALSGATFSTWHIVGVVIIFFSVATMIDQKRRAIAKLNSQDHGIVHSKLDEKEP